MAFRDSDGRITIDEIAAQADISNINAAIDELQQARNSLDEIRCQAQSFSGKTAVAVEDISVILIRDYENLILRLEEMIDAINCTVEKYRKIDESLKELISGQG